MQDKQLGQQLEVLRMAALGHIVQVLKNPKLSGAQRAAWETMQRNVGQVAIGVNPSQDALFEGTGYKVEGEHVVQSVVGKGLVEYISLPKDFIFRDGRLTLEGMTTLFHEWAHNPLRFGNVQDPQAREFMEEQLADALAVNLAMKMKFPPKAIFEHIVGRLPFIGLGPYRRYLRMVEEYAGQKFRKEARRDIPRLSRAEVERRLELVRRKRRQIYGLLPQTRTRREPWPIGASRRPKSPLSLAGRPR